MKKYISMFILWFSVLPLAAQGVTDDYNPSNPPNPSAEENVATYLLQTQTVPVQAGSTNVSGSQYTAGSSVYVYTSGNSNYVFKQWEQNGQVVSTSSSFYYTMPAKETVLTAVYEYSPTSPENPSSGEENLTHLLKVQGSPAQGGSFNYSSVQSFTAGQSVSLYAYPNTNYTFKHWEINGNVVSTNRTYNFNMANVDVTVVGVFDYSPANPQNPGSNSWDAETGELIMDDFTAGNLSNAVYNVTGGNTNNVQTLLVVGTVSDYDIGYMNNYSFSVIDFSRCSGATYVPSWSYENNTSLTSISLPASITRIGYGSFSNCQALTSLCCYATMPPTLENNVFEGIKEQMVVFVPAASIDLYQDADGWKELTLLPLQSQVNALEVNLPAGSEDGRFKNMFIELVNVKSGQRMRYVISDRTVYTFQNLMHNTTWNIYVKNATGQVLGQINGVEMQTNDRSVTFEHLVEPQTIRAFVRKPDGTDVTSQLQLTWLDATGSYLGQGNTLAGVVPLDSNTVILRTTLPQALAMEYQSLPDAQYVVQETGNVLSQTLSPLPTARLTGTVRDVLTGVAIGGATVTVSQTLNGRFSKALVTTANAQGFFSIDAFDAPTSITAVADDYISKTIAFDKLDLADGVATLADLTLKSINGATITLNFTYTSSSLSGSAAETQSYYSDYQNVTYTIRDLTTGQDIRDFNVQYPQIVLLEDVALGDSLQLTAVSKTAAFRPVVATCAVDSMNRAELTFGIKQLGQISATFLSTENTEVTGILYDSRGKFVKSGTYANAQLGFTDLADGSYTLITMGSSKLFNTIYDLSKFAQAGLMEGSDYVASQVAVQSGVITPIRTAFVPFFDESKLYYTGSNTSFSVNKTQITAGNYLTLSGRIDFKSLYAGEVSDVKLIVDLPEESSLVDNSVMVGSALGTYMTVANRVTIPVSNLNDRIRFCIIPTAGGDYAPSAYAQFSYNGKTITQPIGSANFTVKDLSISVPSVVAKTSVPVNGTATGKSNVRIYDNGVLIGETTSLANGEWATTCELDNPYNLSTHQIYAKVTTLTGLEMQSETQEVTYDVSMIVPQTVTMLYYNPEYVGQYNIVYDLINKTVTPSSYYFFPYKNYPNWWETWETEPKGFTFVADLSNNDTTIVSGVTIRVYTDRGNWRNLNAKFDTSRNKWVAASNFEADELPVGVDVEIVSSAPVVMDTEEIRDLESSSMDFQHELEGNSLKSESLRDEIEDILNQEHPDLTLVDEKMQEFGVNLSSGADPDILDNMSDEEFDEYISLLCERYDTFSVTDLGLFEESLIEYVVDSVYTLAYSGLDYSVKVSKPYTTDIEKLVADGFTLLPNTQNQPIYERTTEDSYIRIDLVAGVCVTMNVSNQQNRVRSLIKLNNGDKASIFAAILDAITAITKTKAKLSDFLIQYKFELNKASVAFVNEDQTIANAIKAVEKRMAQTSGFKYLSLVEERTALLSKRAAMTASWAAQSKAMQWIVKGLGATINSLTNLIVCLKSEYDNCVKISNTDVPGCLYVYSPNIANGYELEIDALYSYVRNWALWTIGRCAVYAVGDIVLSESVVVPIILTIGECAAEIAYSHRKQKEFDGKLSTLKFRMKQSEREFCNKNDDEKCPKCGHNPCVCPPPYPRTEPIHDPSGYVYEGVPSNRVQGVTATAFYKESGEDMYGDPYEKEVLWDAEEYAQENPLFTDENGFYRWDVPQGLWRVKFEKEGYQTTYSEWLPVPPPQLDVNIAMTQDRQPEVKEAKAYEDGVEVEFDKYMLPESLTTDNIIVKRNGDRIEGNIEMLNSESTDENNAEGPQLASKVKFTVPEGTKLLSTDEVTLIVTTGVRSYANLPMQETYTQTFDVEKAVRKIAADSLLTVLYEGTRTLQVSALPAEAAVGKTLRVRALSTLIADISADGLTPQEDGTATIQLDDAGQATLTVSGELPGSTAIQFSIDDTNAEGQTLVKVQQAVSLVTAIPRASRASGSAVYRGTLISLSCENENAKIWYSLDGSCPCDPATALVYTQPIAINDDVVTIKAMAQAEGFEESEVVTFEYTVKQNTQELALSEGWTWISHNVAEDLAISSFPEKTMEVKSQTKGVIRDATLGLFGNLSQLAPTEAYKVKTEASVTLPVTGDAFNASKGIIRLERGWNWIGYPLDQIMTPTEALINLSASEGDILLSLSGSADFIEGEWVGDLESMKPGEGYMIKVGTTGDLLYNTSIVSKAASQARGHLKMNQSPWSVDEHRYADVMPLRAQLFREEEPTEDEEFTVAAFCGTECRGIGKYVQGVIFMNVHGEGQEDITFQAVHNEKDYIVDIQEYLPFHVDVVGSYRAPYALHLGDETVGVAERYNRLGVWPTMATTQITVNLGGMPIDRLTLTGADGKMVRSSASRQTQEVINVTNLPAGIYIVAAQSGSEFFYKKIMKVNK